MIAHYLLVLALAVGKNGERMTFWCNCLSATGFNLYVWPLFLLYQMVAASCGIKILKSRLVKESGLGCGIGIFFWPSKNICFQDVQSESRLKNIK